MKVEQLMSRQLKTCHPSHDLACAAQILWEDDVGCVPIVDDDGRAIAMLTDRDIAMAAYTQGRPLAEIAVSQAMSRELYSCGPGDSIAAAEDLMRSRQVRRIPVVDGAGKLVGLLSFNDLAREAFRERDLKKPELTSGEVVGALAGIGSPRGAASVQAHHA